MATALAKSIRTSLESDEIDLGGYDEAQTHTLIEAAFKEEFPISEMIRLTFVVGAGKGGRSKYHDDQAKWMASALKAEGFEDDRGASCVLQCAGSFKYQHDTGRNLKYIHVFPKVAPIKEGDDGVAEEEEDEGMDMSPQWLCAVSEVDTFHKMVAAKMPAWVQKKRCIQLLKDYLTQMDEVEACMVQLKPLSTEQSKLYENLGRENLEEKIVYLQDEMKKMVDAGKLTTKERSTLVEQVSGKIETCKEAIAESQDKPKKVAKLEQQLTQLNSRKSKLEGITPITHPLKNEAEMKKLWRKLVPMEKLLVKAGPKGRWSTKLTPKEVEFLGDKEELDEEMEQLQAMACNWFEEPAEFNLRLTRVKGTVKPAAAAQPKKPAKSNKSAGGWATVAPKKKTANFARGGAAQKKSAGGGFAALYSDSDSDSD